MYISDKLVTKLWCSTVLLRIPIAFAYHTLSSAEKYAQIEKEGFAIIFAVTNISMVDHLLDHQPLNYLFSESHQIPVMAASRFHHWLLILSIPSNTAQVKSVDTFIFEIIT